MAMLLTKRVPLTIQAVIDFYFRRIRRIVPLFLFVIFCTLLAGIFLLAPAEFPNLSTDAFTSSIFLSNFLNVHDSGYFNLYSEFVLFKHTWSLAVEIQVIMFRPHLLGCENVRFCVNNIFSHNFEEK
jgi:peptidoglycan/LPS O-acetylase OafA/YrhL